MTDVVAIKDQVEAAVQAALTEVLPAELAGADPVVRRSDRADFQSNATLAVAKKAHRAPRDIAADVVTHVAEGESPKIDAEVSGPGFLNLTVPDQMIWSNVAARLADDRLGVSTSRTGERVVVDYSAPNVAKQMHVGHLRSTIIGDTLARVFDHLGAGVIRQNHIGDWGTQFGMLIQYLDEHPDAAWRGRGAETMDALDGLYKAARKEFEADPAFADRARSRVVALQAGDEATVATWRDLVAESETAFEAIYQRLNIQLDHDNFDGESRYNPALPGIVEALTEAGIAIESDGAMVTFTDGVVNADGDPVPLIVRKRDGGYGYAATDLATIRLRVDEYRADRILYVVDARQALHFRLVFDTARRAGWLPESVHARHVAFGTVLGTDGRPFKTRSGDTVRLTDLLDEAVGRAHAILAERDTGLDAEELDAIANAAGIAAVKYADLSNTRTKDYVYDPAQMVSFTGNTGVYLQYAHARIRSILRKAEQTPPDTTATGTAATSAAGPDAGEPGMLAGVDVTAPLEPAERALALALDEFDQALRDVADTLEPHRLCGYLYAVATAYTKFYDTCPVLTAPNPTTRTNRLALCDLTGRTLDTGLGLLGITAPERM
ncbi:arginine--tRNA ligase [Myceligenerans pegani]|uniref:arginine--tRNA ligase n=1 Tax=Myceligenerans pegani TaxID=2776917 RepID=UPI00299ED440|nr:arginine--tRNA ligase [Myceligenerans sp. TRM 65318]